jgi:hypothetical protein
MGSIRYSTARDGDSDDDDVDWSGEDWSDDGEDDAEDDAAPCPECGADMSTLIDRCPHCGYWVTEADQRRHWPGARWPMWQRATAVIILLVVILTLLIAGVLIL